MHAMTQTIIIITIIIITYIILIILTKDKKYAGNHPGLQSVQPVG